MSNESKLVVKVCNTSDPLVLHSIRNEAAILPKLDCPLINRFEAYYEDPERNKAYLVVEKAGDKTLTEFMNELKGKIGTQNRLTDDEIRQIMGKLFQATEYLHSHNICHRDLKPDNIMITKIPTEQTPRLEPIRVKIVDFNVA